MQKLGDIGFEFEQAQEENPQQKTVDILAEAHGISAAEMTALWRGAGLAPPVDEARILKYRASKLLIPELQKRKDKRREDVAADAVETAWQTTNMVALAKREPHPRFRELLEKISSPRLRIFAEKYDPSESGGALIVGPTGIGKSVACLCVMIRCMRKSALDSLERSLSVPIGYSCERVAPERWYSVDAIDLGLAQQHAKLGDPEPPVIAKAKNAPKLIIDDLGWERGFHVEALVQVAAPRYRIGLASLVTSGEKHAALRERYTDAVLRRFWNIDGRDGSVIDLWQE